MKSEGEVLKQWLDERRIPVVQFAEIIDIQRPVVQRYFNEAKLPDNFKFKLAAFNLHIPGLGLEAIRENLLAAQNMLMRLAGISYVGNESVVYSVEEPVRNYGNNEAAALRKTVDDLHKAIANQNAYIDILKNQHRN